MSRINISNGPTPDPSRIFSPLITGSMKTLRLQYGLLGRRWTFRNMIRDTLILPHIWHICGKRCVANQYFIWSDARPKPYVFTIDYKVHEDPSTAIWTFGKTLENSKYDSRHTSYTPMHICGKRCIANQYFIWSDARPKPYLFTIDHRVHEDPSTAIWTLG